MCEFSRWKYPERIVKNCILLAAPRNGLSDEALKAQIADVQKQYQAQIFPLDCPNLDISSNILRSKLQAKESIRYFVPEKVYEYIKEKGLYHV